MNALYFVGAKCANKLPLKLAGLLPYYETMIKTLATVWGVAGDVNPEDEQDLFTEITQRKDSEITRRVLALMPNVVPHSIETERKGSILGWFQSKRRSLLSTELTYDLMNLNTVYHN